MKFSFMTFSCPGATLEEVFELAQNFGYSGVEPRVASGHKHGIELETGPAARRVIRDMADEAGIQICCVATSCRFADPQNSAQNVEDARRYIELASDIGSSRLRVFGGNFPQEISREVATQTLIESLLELAPFAQERSVTLCLETHDAWTDAREVAGVMQAVNHPNIAVNWDIMHPVRQSNYTLEESFKILAPWIRHVHIHDGSLSLDKLQIVPIGEGDFNHGVVLRLLQEANYDGFLSGEWIEGTMAPAFFASHLRREIIALRGLAQATAHDGA
jgi:sugar phosphate isomerase/epimerase